MPDHDTLTDPNPTTSDKPATGRNAARAALLASGADLAPKDDPARATIADLASGLCDLAERITEKLPAPAPHAARLSFWCARDNIPESTVRAASAAGKGPKTYKMGRLDFCTAHHWNEWHTSLAETGGFRLSGGRRDDVA